MTDGRVDEEGDGDLPGPGEPLRSAPPDGLLPGGLAAAALLLLFPRPAGPPLRADSAGPPERSPLPVQEAGPTARAAGSRPREGPERWRQQVVRDLLRPWTRNARDREHGGVRTHLTRDWSPAGPPEKYPGMLGRHLFSYSAGYLLTGDDRYLELADSVQAFLVGHGWDRKRGGWFDRLHRTGRPAARSKSTFVQVYAATGLAFHYLVTHDPDALRLARRTNRLLERRFRDREHGGYYQSLTRGLEVADSTKSAASQLAPVSGHLLYLYAATREEAFLRQAERLVDLAGDRMLDAGSGWLLERFGPRWRLRAGSRSRYNVGHNLELAWMRARIYLATGQAEERRSALRLGRDVARRGYRPAAGAWVHSVPRSEGGERSDRVVWWIQAYGNMTEITLHRLAPGEDHLERYRRGARFWNRSLVDDHLGGAFLSVGTDGDVRKGRKGSRWKTSYHAVEHGLWNWLGEKLWVETEPAALHFRIDPEAAGSALHPLPIPAPGVRIASVRVAGRAWKRYRPSPPRVELPGREHPAWRPEAAVRPSRSAGSGPGSRGPLHVQVVLDRGSPPG